MGFRARVVGLFLGPILFVFIYFFLKPEGMSMPAVAVLAATAWVATWWVTEVVPIPVTSLLPIVLLPLTGAMPIADVTVAYGHPLVFLYVGGFIIAVAIERWDLHKRIALNIIKIVGTDLSRIILGFMLATAILSMWISNTATSVMMLPIGMAMVSQLGKNARGAFGKALMLGIAYSASIGGLATLIGTPTNLVFAGVVEELYGEQITFAQWIAFGLPISSVLLGIAWWYLTRIAFKIERTTNDAIRQEIEREIAALGPWSQGEKVVAAVFAITALCWILRSFVLVHFFPGVTDTVIAIAGAIVLFLVPAAPGGVKAMTWDHAVQIPWGIVILFGGGLAIAGGFQDTGLADWIGSQMALLAGIPLLLIILFLIASVNFLTEITSNVATASMIMPVLASLSLAMGVHPYLLMVAATVAASCAFMLPVATPPNAVVFGSNYLNISDMVRAGFRMNLVSILFLTLAVFYLLPILWDLPVS